MRCAFAFMLLMLLGLAGCGFQPLYAPGASAFATSGLPRISLANIPERNGQILRNELIDRLGHTEDGSAEYGLRVSLVVRSNDLLIAKDATARRAKLLLFGEWQLNDAFGKKLAGANLRAEASYNILDEQYGSLAARENAERRGLEELASAITADVARYFARENVLKEKSGEGLKPAYETLDRQVAP